MALNDEQKWKGAPYQMRPTTPYKMEAPAPVVQRVVPAVEKPAPVAAKPAPVAAKPAAPKPGAFARGVADTVAFANDAVMAPSKALADGVNRAAVGVLNVGRQGVGMAPVQPREFNYTATQDKLAAVRAQNQAAQQPAVAAPRVKFAGTDAMPDSMFKSPTQQPPQRQSPSQRMTDDQANAAEVNARTATQPSSPQTGVGASVGAGGAAPKASAPNPPAVAAPNFANVTGGANTSYGRPADPASRPGTPQGAGAPSAAGADAPIGNPNDVIGQYNGRNITRTQANDLANKLPTANGPVAFGPNGSFGYSTDIARPTSSPIPSFAPVPMPAAPSAPPRRANTYDIRKAEEAAEKFRSEIDNQIFRLSFAASRPGRDGRAAKEAIVTLMGLKGGSVDHAGKRAVDVAAGDRDAASGTDRTNMEQAGANQRQQMAGDVTREGNFLDYDAKNRATDASLIEKPQYVTDRSGNLVQVTGGKAAGVTGSDGAVIQMPPPAQAQQRDYQAEAFNSLVSDLLDGQRDMNGALPPNAVENAIAQAQKVQAARQPKEAQGGAAKVTSKAQLDALPKGARYLAPDGKVYVKN